MDKLVVLAVVVLISVSIWAVIPSESQMPKTAQSTKAQGTDAKGGEQQSRAKRKPSGQTNKTQRAAAKATGNAAIESGQRTRSSAAPKSSAQSSNSREEMAVNPQLINKAVKSFKARPDTEADDYVAGSYDNPFGHVRWDGEMDYHELEDVLMKHYAKRTPEAGLPNGLQAHDLLSDSLLKAMNVSKNAPVVMIGDFAPSDPRSVTDTLKRARKGEHETGFTFDDGSSGGRRVYVKVVTD